MRLLARNSKISNGEVILNGTDLLKEDKKGMRNIRGREVAMIFQEPMNSLNPCMKIEKQLTELLRLVRHQNRTLCGLYRPQRTGRHLCTDAVKSIKSSRRTEQLFCAAAS